MTTSTSHRLAWLAAGIAALALAGCGGDGSLGDGMPPAPPPPPPPVDQVPDSATASIDAWFAYGLAQSSSADTTETATPLMFDLVVHDAPTSETAEPTALP